MRVRLVTSQNTVFDGHVHMAVFPGSEGEFGVLDRHAPFLSKLSQGSIRFFDTSNTVIKTFKIDEGYAKVTSDECIVVAKTVNLL